MSDETKIKCALIATRALLCARAEENLWRQHGIFKLLLFNERNISNQGDISTNQNPRGL